MIHDCTHHRALPGAGRRRRSIFDLDAMTTGGDVLAWKPELGTRIACVPRDGGAVRWLHTDPFFVWHYGNAYDDGDDVIVDFSWWSSFSLGPDPTRTGAFTRARALAAHRRRRAHPPRPAA